MNFEVSDRDFMRFIKTQTKTGQRICIKYPLPVSKKIRLQRRLRAITASWIKQPFLQILPLYDAAEKNRLEVAKLGAFRAAHLETPEVLVVCRRCCIFADPGRNLADIAKKLRMFHADLHDELLICCAAHLGRVHAAGLCCGRAPLETMFLGKTGIGFWEFHEYPEHFMPPAAAQARDIYFLLLALAAAAVHKDYVLQAAFRIWRRQVGLEVLESLRAGIGFFRPLLRIYGFFMPLFWGRRGSRERDRLRVLRFLAVNMGV